MSLFFITGVAGAGKTAVWHELKARGYEAYDTDEDGFAKWQNNDTGYIHPKSSIKKETRTADFLREHSWKVPRDEVEHLAARASNETVFLCGVASNEDELRDLFAGLFELVIDEETLKHRLATRTGNDWGKQPHELEKTINDQRNAHKTYKERGCIIVDSTRPQEVVVDEILKAADEIEKTRKTLY